MWKVGNGTLNYLNISYNALQGMESSFIHLFQSERAVLDLSSNLLQGPLPIPPPSSIYFSLSNNSFHGEIPVQFCSARSLQFLDLSQNKLSGQIPQCLGELSDVLLVLNLGGNNLSGPLLQTFKEGCPLRTLNLSKNRFEGRLPSSLSNCWGLDVLNLAHNQITDIFPFWIDILSQLRILILRNNEFYGPIANVRAGQGFLTLHIIDVSGNRFTGGLPPDFFRNWEATREEDSHSEHLGVHLLLVDVDLQLVGADDLQLLGAYHNKEVYTVTSKGFLFAIRIFFKVIDVSNNRFEGNIPDTLGIFESLRVLNMSHNSFSGQIPISFGSLAVLEVLDLSDNKISGEIPWQLAHMDFLEVLNLSQNRLVGRIPDEKQFSTFLNDSYLGNLGLCGSPLTTVCSAAPPAASSASNPSASVLDWDDMIMGLGVGYTAGLGVLFSILAIWSEGRKEYSKCIDRMLLCILPSKLFPPKRPPKHRNGGRIQANRGRRK